MGEGKENPLADERLARALESIPGWRSGEGEIDLLEGGITNLNYRVRTAEGAFALRLCGEGSERLGIDRGMEYECNRIAASLGIAPEVVHFRPGGNVLVTRFVTGETLTPEKARRPATVERIVRAMRLYHEGPLFPGRFSLFEIVRDYISAAEEHGVAVPAAMEGALERMAGIESVLSAGVVPRPCHNDLLAGNFIDDGEKVWLLDWEYAAMGDPFFDLGNFAVNQELDEEGCEHLARCYFGAARTGDLARIHLMRVASLLRESSWGYLQVALSKLDFDYVEYGRKFLEQFLALAARKEVERWMGQAAGSPRE